MSMDLTSQLKKNFSPEILAILSVAGEIARDCQFPLYLVGGVVRDIMLGRRNLDLDLVVEGDAIQLVNFLAKAKKGKVVVHPQFGTAKFRSPHVTLDFAAARSETYSHPGALPTVSPGSIEQDLLRRDFSINAMAIELDVGHLGELVDPCDGERDLNDGVIRVLHRQSFIDDATRILRGIRYEQRLDFRIEPVTKELLARDAEMLATMSGDRIRHELELTFDEDEPENVLRRAEELGVITHIFPLLRANDCVLSRLRGARRKDFSVPHAVYFSLLAHRFSRDDGDAFIKRLKFNREISCAVKDTIRLKEQLIPFDYPLAPSDIYERLRGYSNHAILACALSSKSKKVADHLYLYLDRLRNVKTLLDGDALRKMGVPPGQVLGEALRELLRVRLDGKVDTRQEEEAWMTLWLRDHAVGG